MARARFRATAASKEVTMAQCGPRGLASRTPVPFWQYGVHSTLPIALYRER